ncbi:hypothetical protein AMTRI_Chr13g89970 [Amborella trichopoda]
MFLKKISMKMKKTSTRGLGLLDGYKERCRGQGVEERQIMHRGKTKCLSCPKLTGLDCCNSRVLNLLVHVLAILVSKSLVVQGHRLCNFSSLSYSLSSFKLQYRLSIRTCISFSALPPCPINVLLNRR